MHKQAKTIAEAGTHSFTREQAEPFAIRTLRETLESYPPNEQARIREHVRQQLRDEARSREFAAHDQRGKRVGSALSRMAWDVYGIRAEG